MRHLSLALLAIAAWLPASPALAQQAAASDGTADRFMFQMDGVTQAEARADLDYCIDLARFARTPRDGAGGPGLLGRVLNDTLANTDRRHMRNAILRRCMALHGYRRFELSAADWDAAVAGGDMVLNGKGEVDPQVAVRFAALAAGPMPTTRRLDP